MPAPILATKLNIPYTRGETVPRARLFERLDSGTSGRLTLVSAPAGYGKSTLLSEWVQQGRRSATAWLTLDAEDNDPIRFWSHFLATLERIPFLAESEVVEDFSNHLQAAPLPDHPSLLGCLITNLVEIPDRFLLILDDFHTITEPQLLEGVLFLVEHLLPGTSGMHLVIASRIDPPWPLARLRVRNEVNEVRARELRFTPGETAEFLNQVMHLSLSSAELLELEVRTEGWIAGLQMAALSLRGRADVSGFLAGFTGGHRFVLDYLVEEVLNQQTSEDLDFLLHTSILERLTGSLCAAVTGNDRSPEILLKLEKENMFLDSLDDQRTWYRYHHLFAELLEKQLGSKFPDLIPELHRKASRWYLDQGLIPESVAHALKSADWDYAAEMIEGNVMDLIQRGEILLAQRWLASLPDGEIRSRPVLCVAQAWASAKYGTVAFAEELLAQAEAALKLSPGGDGDLDPEVHQWVSRQIAVLEVVIARSRGDPTQRQQALALEVLDRVEAEGDLAAYATTLLRLGFCYLDLGKDGEADRVFSEAFESGQASGNHYAAHAASYGRMVIARRHGRLHDLEAICHHTLEAVHRDELQQQSLEGITLIMLGGLYYEWDDLREAKRHLTKGLELVKGVEIPELLVKGCFSLACVEMVMGVTETLPNLVELAEGGNPELGLYAAALQARLDLTRAQKGTGSNDTMEARRWAESQQLKLRKQSTYDWEVFEKLIYARVLCHAYQTSRHADGKTDLVEVLDFLTLQRQTLEALGWAGILVEVEAVRAVILEILGREAEAVGALESALVLAEDHNYVRTFVDEGEVMKGLLQRAVKQGRHRGYAQKVMVAFPVPEATVQARMGEPKTDLVDSFSERELQVLHLLNTRLSVPEIAAELFLAPSTVRTHVQRIYYKLEVHNRIEALQKAGDLGLL